MRSIAPWRYTTLSQVMSPTSSTTSTTQRLLQRSSRMNPWHRHWTVVLVRCGTRRWACWKSALFTTVHSRARRIRKPETNLSLSWRKFVSRSVLLHTHKYGETRIQTKFRFVSRTEIKSRLRKLANQDSPWKTKRANSCWGQIWDPEARTSSRVW